jgi:hypothetical protein
VRLGPVVVEVLDVLDLGVDACELLARAKGPVDDGLELDDAPHAAVDLDVHPVAELVRGDGLGHRSGRV